MCLISPTHYTIQYCLRWQEAAYRAQLHRSISEMLRHGCAGARRSGGAAGRSLGVRCGLLPQRGNDSSEISFHVSLPCLQKRIGGGTSPNIGPALSSTCLAVGPSPEDGERERESERVARMETPGARPRATGPGQMLTASASLLANGLLITQPMNLAFLR